MHQGERIFKMVDFYIFCAKQSGPEFYAKNEWLQTEQVLVILYIKGLVREGK